MMRVAILLGTTAVTLAMPISADAQSEDRLSADVSTTAGYSNNPFSTPSDNNTGSGIVTIDIAPRYQRLTARSVITISGDANLQQYLRRYGHNESYSGALDYRGQPSERATTHARIELSSAVLGAFNSYLPLAASGSVTDTGGVGTASASSTTTTVVSTAAAPLTQFSDIGLYGTRSRRNLGRASGDVTLTLSALDTLSISGYAEATRYPSFSTADYEGYNGALGYQRRLSSQLSVGFAGSASAYDYRTSASNSRVYSIQATGSARLTAHLTADGALGVSLVDSDTRASTRSTSLSGNLNLCRRDPISTLCIQLARQVAPTGIVGTQYVTSAGFVGSRRLDERQSISLSGSYSTVGGSNQVIGGVLPVESKYLQFVAGYNRRILQRLSFVASANYRNILDDSVTRSADFGGQIGLNYRLGDLR